jgi:bifunctional DNase/RNase
VVNETDTETETETETEIDTEADAEEDAAEAGEEDAAEDGDEPDEAESPRPEPMSQMLFVDVALVLPSTHPVIILQEADMPYRELRIPIGGAEGVAIGYAARQVATPRPLTHELISRLLDAFDLSLDAVHITSVEGANFVAELLVSGPKGVRSIDCRPSDAIALALRRSISVPIMAAPHVLELAGGGSPSGN